MNSLSIDNHHYIKLPEGVSLALNPAGIAVRSAAFVIDFIIRILIFIPASFLLESLGDAGVGLFLLLLFCLNWFYYIFFELRNGQSPGKRIMKLKVMQDNGLPVSFGSVVIRNLLRPVDALPVGYMLGLLSVMFSAQFKRLGDWAGGTIVVYCDNVAPVQDTGTSLLSAVPRSLTTDEQRALIEFIQRSPQLSEQRQQELAVIVAQALQVVPAEALSYVNELGKYFAGGSR